MKFSNLWCPMMLGCFGSGYFQYQMSKVDLPLLGKIFYGLFHLAWDSAILAIAALVIIGIYKLFQHVNPRKTP